MPLSVLSGSIESGVWYGGGGHHQGGLLGSMGVKQASIHEDLLETSEAQIEEQITSIGLQLGNGWAERLRRALVHYEEECELDNLAANDKHCCEVHKW